MSLAEYGCKLTAQKKATLGIGSILCQSCCYGYHHYDYNIYLKLVSIKHYWLHSLVKFWASIANIKRMRVLQFVDTLEIKANLNNILTWIS